MVTELDIDIMPIIYTINLPVPDTVMLDEAYNGNSFSSRSTGARDLLQ